MTNNNADIELLATLDISSSESEIIRAIKVLESRLQKNANAKIKVNADIDETKIKATIEKLEKILEKKELKVETKSSIESITKEATAMLEVVQAAKKAADEKLEFAEANKRVRESADNTADAILRERNAMGSLDDIDYIMSNITRSGQQGNSVFQQFGLTLRDAFSMYTAANLLQDAIYEVIDAGRESVETVKELNDAATSLRMATGDSYESVKQLLGAYNEMGQELGAITVDVSESADEWLRQGHSIENTNVLITDSMMLSKISNLESAESTKYLTSAMQGYKVAVENVIGIVDKLSAVDLVSATDAGGLAEAMSRTAEGAQIAGISMDRLLGMIATVGEVTQKSMSSIGESYKTIFSRMRDIKDNKLKVIGDDGEIEDLSNVEIVLNSLGIKLRESNQEFRNFQEVLDEVALHWNEYSSVQQSAIAKAFSGVRQQENFLVLMENWDKVLEYTNVAENSSGTAQEKFGYYLESLEAKTNSLKASLENLATTTISDEMYASVLDTSKAVVDLTAETGVLKGLLAGIGTAGSVYAFQQLTHYLDDATQGFANLSEAMSMTRNGTVGINDMQRLIDLTSGLSQSQTRLLLSTDNLTDAQKVSILMNQGLTKAEAQQEIQTWGVASAQNGATAATVTWSSALRGLWATLMANPLILITAAVTAGVMAFNKYKQSQEEAAQATKEAVEKATTLSDEVSELANKYIALSQAVKTDSGAKQELMSTQAELIEKLGLEGESVDKLIEKYGSLSEAIKQAGLDTLKQSQLDLISGVDIARNDLLDVASGGLVGMKNSINAVGDDAVEAFEILEKANLISKGAFGTGGGTFQLVDDGSVEGALANFEKLEQALGVLRDSMTANELTDNSLYKALYERYNEMKDSVEAYNSSISNLNRNLVQQNMFTVLQGSEIPKTQEDFEVFKKELIETAIVSKEFIGTEEDIANAVSNYLTTVPEFEGFYSAPLQKELEQVKSIVDNLGASKEEMISQLNDMSEGFEELDKIYASIKDDAPFDFKLLDDKNFKETFSGLGDVYTDFIEQVTATPNDINACQSAFNDLVTEWISSTKILDGVTEENEKLTASMLEQMGVVNASQIVTDVLKDQENATKFLESAEIDLVNATAEEINSLNILDGELAQSGGAIYDVYLNKKLTSENPIDTSADCNALIAMARQCQVTGENLALLIKLKNTYLTLESDMWGDATKQIAAKEAERLKAQLANTSFAADYKPVVSYKAPSTGKSSGSSSAAKDTKETFDWIERAIKKVQRTITNLGKTVSATYKTWTTRNSALTQQISAINSEISIQQKAYDFYMKKASEVGLNSSYVKKIQDGTINIETIKDESLINKIKEYQDLYDKALAAKDAIADLNDEIASLAKSRFDNVVTQFEEQISLIEHETSVLDALISQTEASSHVVSTSFYESLIDVENKNLAALKKEYTALQNALNQAMAEGKIEKYSSEWYDMTNQINYVELAIIESNTALVEFQKNIRDLEWESFDRLQDMISQITDEADFLIELMSDEDLFNDDGSVTKHGQATFGLHAVSYNTSLEQAKKYYKELSDIRTQLAKDADDVALLEREEELREAFQDTELAAEQQKQALIDLAKEGYNKMLDYMSELIDKQKEMLQSVKDVHDYEKNVREQTEEIARLEKIAQAVANDDSEEGRLRAQQNAVALKEAREALQETEYERYIQDQEKLYDQILGETEQWIDERLSKPEQLLADIVSAVNQNSASILEVLKGETAEVGGALSEEMSSIWGEDTNTVKKPEESTGYISEALAVVSKEFEKLKSDETLSASGDITEIIQEIERIKDSMTEGDSDVVSTYTDGISDNTTNILKVLGRIEDFVGDMDDESYQLLMKEINNSINDTTNGITGSTQGSSNSSSGSSQSSSSSTSTSVSDSSSTSSDSSNWGSWFISKKNSVPDSQLKIDSSIIDRLKFLDYENSFSARAKYYAAMGLGTASSYIGSASQNKAMIDAMRKHGFNRGGRIGSLISSTGEDGFVLANTGEYILTEKDFKALKDMMTVAEPFAKTTMKPPTNLIKENISVNNVFNMDFELNEVQNGREVVDFLIKDKNFERAVQSMTIGRVAGKNSYSKYNYIER